eukprot:TRINITY_DN20160_c0_g1_i1.p1 TRINITY_DN20160_c0_g1~~TRINITY_DN20160_c0_g1_i1.p1  ORF type:complete len:419 (+),score=82.30 TRINITY_DN20160_c0_g1_i1:61-1317(+)
MGGRALQASKTADDEADSNGALGRDRFQSPVEPLDRKETTTRALKIYMKELDAERSAGPEAVEPEKRQAYCGLGCGARGSEQRREFACVLQDMIRKTTLQPETLAERLRVFDHRHMTFDVEDGIMAKFTESRSTQFRLLRNACGFTSEEYLASMCDQPLSGGDVDVAGKSGSFFYRSADRRLVLKTIEQHEYDTLNEILPEYIVYLQENKDSLLCRIFAAYQLTVYNITVRFVVMDNVLPSKPFEVYDLKGTTEDRWADPAKASVLKDNNFREKCVLLDASDRERLLRCVRDDAEFLESLGLMDYSLLVGVMGFTDGNGKVGKGLESIRGELVCADGERVYRVFRLGIIDYLQRWTNKKVAAHWMKKPTLGCCHEIDTEPPRKYCSRFFKYADEKFQNRDAPCISNGTSSRGLNFRFR